jgi:hypothetical protein
VKHTLTSYTTRYILVQFDIASASQVGLPRIIKQTQCDTAEPRNLLDEDFDDTTAVLPPARSQSEHTLSQFLIYKSRVVFVYGQIIDFTTSSTQRNYHEAMRLDTLLNAAYTQKPPILELKPMQRSILDGAELITRRLYIAMSFHHAQMTLHRKYLIPAKTNKKYTYSHTTCIEAALTALKLQTELFEQCQPGRMLHADRWKILSLTQSEFLLATTILCFNLDDDTKNGRVGISAEEAQRSALEGSRAVWERQQAYSKDALTAVRAIGFVLARFESAVDRAGPEEEENNGSFGFTPGNDGGISVGGSMAPTSTLDEAWMNVSSASGFDQDLSLDNMAFDDAAYGAFFEIAQPWETWLQFE